MSKERYQNFTCRSLNEGLSLETGYLRVLRRRDRTRDRRRAPHYQNVLLAPAIQAGLHLEDVGEYLNWRHRGEV